VRIPDATATMFGMPVPSRTGMFENIDGHVGWYLGAKWDVPELGQLAALWYDNNADPDAFTARDTSWRTHFWAASLKAHPFGLTLLAQAMTGDTVIESFGYHYTDFDELHVDERRRLCAHRRGVLVAGRLAAPDG